MTETILLNKSFDITEELIKNNPQKEIDIISEYNDYISKIKSNSQINKTYVRSATFKDDNDDNHNGFIKINNNFQKYTNDSSLLTTPISKTTTETFENNFQDYFKSMTGGFKDYLKL